MEDQRIIKVLLLSTNELVISEIAEIYAELGEPNCKLTKPYSIDGDSLFEWMRSYTDQDEMMIHSDKILTLVDPNEKYLNMYLGLTS